jgi:hypothetical protein
VEVDVETLIELRRDYGLTPGHIREVGRPLMDALGTTDADLVRKIVAETIERMGRVRHALVLTASYGLDAHDAVTSLTTRQNRVAKSLGISVDTVKRDERRAVNELHRLLFSGGARDTLSSRPDDRVGRYMNAIEYVDLDAHHGEAQFSINAANHYHNQGKHIPGTPADDEWRDDHFLSTTYEVRRHAATLIGCLAGWSVESLTPTRPKVRRRSIIQRMDSAQDIVQPGWNSLSALLHLRRWQFFRDVDEGFVDLYVAPSAADPWGGYTEEEYDEAFATRLMEMRDKILVPVTGIVREILQEAGLRLTYSGSVKWEKEGTPVTAGDSYQFRLVIVDDA